MSAVAAIIAVPTGHRRGIYGINFRHMPELDSLVGHPLTLAAISLICIAFYVFFKRRGWL